jgi:uncharacterized protein YjiS (DUF1127 family)
MDARITQAELAFLIPNMPAGSLQPLTREQQEIEAIRLAALEAAREERGSLLRRWAEGLAAGIGAVADALLAWPRRQAVYAELRQLSDRELRDIGLHRAEIHTVFDADKARGPHAGGVQGGLAAPRFRAG